MAILEGAPRPTAGDESCEVRAQNFVPLRRDEGGRACLLRLVARIAKPPYIK
jgi:hypothetical protein